MKNENAFQAAVIQEIKQRIPDADIRKNDSSYRQGVPDLTVCYAGKYVDLECKRSSDSTHRPNQDYFIDRTNRLGGYAAFIYPENREEVLDEMERRLLNGV